MTSNVVKINNVNLQLNNQNSYAIGFGPQCTLIGDNSSAIVLCPSISPQSGTDYTPKFASPVLQLSGANSTHQQQQLVGYGTIANNATIIFNNNNGGFSIYSVDPLATVSSFHHSA